MSRFLPHRESQRSVQTLSGLNRAHIYTGMKPYSYQYVDLSEILTQDNAGYSSTIGKKFDIGGPFSLDRVEHHLNPVYLNTNLQSGPSTAFLAGELWPSDRVGSPSGARAAGTKLLASATPNNPSADFAVLAGELVKDGLPSVFGSGLAKEKANFLKGSSSEYLNYEFGWKPLVSEVKSFAQAVVDHDKILSEYREGSDKHLRRRRALPPQEETWHVEGNGYLLPTSPVTTVEGSMTQTSKIESWFSGAFKYHIPVGDSVSDRFSRYRSDAGKLLGVRLTPDVLWNLAPWSWAVDWFVDVGSVMTNISNLGTDGMAMQYGYAMQQGVCKNHLDFRCKYGKGSTTRIHTTKDRVPASPYGFNVAFDEFSIRQLAICAALGITRGQR